MLSPLVWSTTEPQLPLPSVPRAGNLGVSPVLHPSPACSPHAMQSPQLCLRNISSSSTCRTLLSHRLNSSHRNSRWSRKLLPGLTTSNPAPTFPSCRAASEIVSRGPATTPPSCWPPSDGFPWWQNETPTPGSGHSALCLLCSEHPDPLSLPQNRQAHSLLRAW